MKKKLLMLAFVVTFFMLSAVSASAAVNDIVKVGLRYGDNAMFSANLENVSGGGYEFGYYNDDRSFTALGRTDQTTISMTAAGTIYLNEGDGTYSQDMPEGTHRFLGPWHVQIGEYASFDEAAAAAIGLGGYPAWVNFVYVVRVGCYASQGEAEEAAAALGQGTAIPSSSTGVMITVTGTTEILFEFDTSGVVHLGVRPGGEQTWFRGYRYMGGFEYPRVTGGNLNVINVIGLEDYVKGVIPYEMSSDWPQAALEAQAVCARTYACRNTSHQSTHGFDMCNTTDCQVYYGCNKANERTDAAVDATAGQRLYYNGELVQYAVYHSSNGGATEDCINVWGSDKPYLVGKPDPYEAQVTIPNYQWTTTYTAAELTYIMEQRGYSIGTVKNVYVAEYTPMGNVRKIVFEGTSGTKTLTGEACRTVFYSSTYNKSIKSLRYGINGGGPSGSGRVYVNQDSTALTALDGLKVLTGSGMKSLSGNEFTILSASGTTGITLGGPVKPTTSSDGTFTLTGTGSGHNLGMSQQGARAMAELGYTYLDILQFYYTNVTVQ